MGTTDFAAVLRPDLSGRYETPGKRSPFRVQERFGELLIFAGRRADNPKAEPTLTVFDRDEALLAVLRFLAEHGPAPLGACPEDRLPEPDTVEAVLRGFALGGTLGSYIPPILARRGAIEIYREGRQLYARLKPTANDDADAPQTDENQRR